MKLMSAAGLSLGENLGLKVLSLILASTAWIVAQGEQTYHATIVVPVEYRFPESLILTGDDPPPEQVVMQTSGSRTAMKSLQEDLRGISIRYEVDLLAAEPGRAVHSFRQPPDGMPDTVTIHTVSPSEVEFVFDNLVTRTIPVELRTRGQLPEGYVETGRSTQPAQVALRGAQADLQDLEDVKTLALRLHSLTSNFEGQLDLDLGDIHLAPSSPTAIQASIRIEETVGERKLDGLQVQIPNGATSLTTEPNDCAIELRGPLPVLLDLGPAAVRPQVVGLGEIQPGAAGGTSVAWTSDDATQTGPRLAVTVDHPRAEEVRVHSVVPARFRLLRQDDETGEPHSRPDSSQQGEVIEAGDDGPPPENDGSEPSGE